VPSDAIKTSVVSRASLTCRYSLIFSIGSKSKKPCPHFVGRVGDRNPSLYLPTSGISALEVHIAAPRHADPPAWDSWAPGFSVATSVIQQRVDLCVEFCIKRDRRLSRAIGYGPLILFGTRPSRILISRWVRSTGVRCPSEVLAGAEFRALAQGTRSLEGVGRDAPNRTGDS
jgi:hypothetical protein